MKLAKTLIKHISGDCESKFDIANARAKSTKIAKKIIVWILVHIFVRIGTYKGLLIIQ